MMDDVSYNADVFQYREFFPRSPKAAKAISAANADVARLSGEDKYAEALTLARQTLERAEKELGKDHPQTLISVTQSWPCRGLAACYDRSDG